MRLLLDLNYIAVVQEIGCLCFLSIDRSFYQYDPVTHTNNIGLVITHI